MQQSKSDVVFPFSVVTLNTSSELAGITIGNHWLCAFVQLACCDVVVQSEIEEEGVVHGKRMGRRG